MNGKIKGILFDFNGTLFFDSGIHLKAFKKYLSEHCLDTIDEEFATKRIFGKDNRTIYTDIFGRAPSEEELKQFNDDKEGIYRQLCRDNGMLSKFTKGAEELLDFLKENKIPYCLATGSDIDNVEFYFNEMNLGRWFSFDNIVYFDQSFPGKPQPDTYLLAAKKLGLSPSECIVFEDGTSGILSARRAEVGGVVAIYEEGFPSPVTAEAYVDAVYHDLTDWREILYRYGL